MKETAAGAPAAGCERLITNLQYATIVRGGGPVRTSVSALVLQDPQPVSRGGSPVHTVKGFGPDYAWPVFDLVLGCDRFAYQTARSESPHVFIGNDGDTGPLTRGARLRWADGTTIDLLAEDADRPLDIVDVAVDRVAEVLAAKAADYWVAPNMPVLHWPLADTVRRALVKPSLRL